MSKAEPQRPLKILKDAVVPGQHGVVPPLHTVCVNRVGCPKWTALPRWGPECLWGRGCLALPALLSPGPGHLLLQRSPWAQAAWLLAMCGAHQEGKTWGWGSRPPSLGSCAPDFLPGHCLEGCSRESPRLRDRAAPERSWVISCSQLQ